MDLALTWQRFTELADVPAHIAFLIVLGVAVRFALSRLIDRVVGTTAGLPKPKNFLGSQKAAALLSSPGGLYHERRVQRAHALGSLFKSISTAVIFGVTFLMVLEQLGYNLAPIIASAGVVGVAIGFGAQNLVKDFISGVFMLLEDQYGVGDVIDMGQATGTVEGIGLRVTRLRDGDGVLWHVRNGEIVRVGNKSQGWSSLVLDVSVAYDEDVAQVEELINDTARALSDEDEWRDRILEAPHVVGIEEVNGAALTLRMIGKTRPNEHFGVQRELRLRLKALFDAKGIRVPAPIWPGQPGQAAGV
ncbi:mechanosensitive ion channel family protein [Actinopolymorpha singaporensis]|uniref:Small conductance mechanosensitive channel n=1 Tax=Actinopolymorpha singaporensis TaxID=117157 RepID=A0A1H1U8J4_9ACTN|nr:mechanosensitive ion channel family protein [Actinopolymorpha singaporensis]SDS68798.1 small conductance mechanosensitive channel [Actinopolymorpha singaporensis]